MQPATRTRRWQYFVKRLGTMLLRVCRSFVKQKGGKYVVLQGKADYVAPDDEIKEVYGVALSQKR